MEVRKKGREKEKMDRFLMRTILADYHRAVPSGTWEAQKCSPKNKEGA